MKVLTTLIALVLMLTVAPVASAAPEDLPKPSGCSNASEAIPASTDRRPVVYVGGWISTGGSLGKAAQLLQDQLGDAYQVYRFDYAALATTWPVGTKAADCLAHYLLTASRAYRGEPGGVLAVAHSMGGLALRSAAKVLTDTGDGAALLGFVTIATPHRGSPLGDTAAAGWLQSLNEVWSIWANNAERPPVVAGTDAARCLAANAGCTRPPYVEGDQRIAMLGTQITIERQLFGITWGLKNPRVRVFGDSIVPLPSAIGYDGSGVGPMTTTQLLGSDTLECLDTQSELLRRAAQANGSLTGSLLSAAWDNAVADSFNTGEYHAVQLPHTLMALGSSCSHLNILTKPWVVARTADYLTTMVTAAGRPVEERELDRRRWLYDITGGDPDGTGTRTQARYGSGSQEHDNSTAHALGCSEDKPVVHEYDLGGIYESLQGEVGHRLGSDPTVTSSWMIDVDGQRTIFSLTGRETHPLSIDLTGKQKLTVSAHTAPQGGACPATSPVGVLGNAYVTEVKDVTPTKPGDSTKAGLAATHGWPTKRRDSVPAYYAWLGAATAWGVVKIGMVDWLACDKKLTCVAGTRDEVLITVKDSSGFKVVAEFAATEPAKDKLKSLNASAKEIKDLLRNP